MQPAIYLLPGLPSAATVQSGARSIHGSHGGRQCARPLLDLVVEGRRGAYMRGMQRQSCDNDWCCVFVPRMPPTYSSYVSQMRPDSLDESLLTPRCACHCTEGMIQIGVVDAACLIHQLWTRASVSGSPAGHGRKMMLDIGNLCTFHRVRYSTKKSEDKVQVISK
ncbi:hypothetical protein F4801DRAFT_437946 [Xylaria longipes]|nr:hypothetical protein F4801DRAFT_437946 [Xylaria longipes]